VSLFSLKFTKADRQVYSSGSCGLFEIPRSKLRGMRAQFGSALLFLRYEHTF
jgi:hypothetical protein